MAYTALTVRELTERNKFLDAEDLTALTEAVATDGENTPTYGATFAFKERDDKYLLLIDNAHATVAKDVTIKAGNGIQGVNDLVLEKLGAGKFTAVTIESGRFKNVTGDNKGKVVIVGASTDIKVAVFRLP